jgi:hypothetical protein
VSFGSTRWAALPPPRRGTRVQQQERLGHSTFVSLGLEAIPKELALATALEQGCDILRSEVGVRWWALVLVACGGPAGPTSAADCIATTGDNCDCEPKCMTQEELDEAQKDGVCDLGCSFGDGSSSEPDWTCTVVDGACTVVEPSDGA